MSDDYNITATFAQDNGDTDDDGLSNYYELALLGTNPESADTDGDGFSDLDENATGIDPPLPIVPCMTFRQTEKTLHEVREMPPGIRPDWRKEMPAV